MNFIVVPSKDCSMHHRGWGPMVCRLSRFCVAHLRLKNRPVEWLALQTLTALIVNDIDQVVTRKRHLLLYQMRIKPVCHDGHLNVFF